MINKEIEIELETQFMRFNCILEMLVEVEESVSKLVKDYYTDEVLYSFKDSYELDNHFEKMCPPIGTIRNMIKTHILEKFEKNKK